MSLINDPIGDMLTRIRNGQMRMKEFISCPDSKMRRSVLNVLKKQGYISDFISETSVDGHACLSIKLKYYQDKPVIKKIKRISKPGCHLYCKSKDIPKCGNGLGTVILSTSSGIMSDSDARRNNVGGEILCEVF